jgi:hypothetical protein
MATLPTTTYVTPLYRSANISNQVRCGTFYDLPFSAKQVHKIDNCKGWKDATISPNVGNFYSILNNFKIDAKVKYGGVIPPEEPKSLLFVINYRQDLLAQYFYPFPIPTLFSVATGWKSPYALTAGVQFYSYWS